MTGRNVLLLLVAAFFLVALVLIYNAYYKPTSASGVAVPAVSDQQ